MKTLHIKTKLVVKLIVDFLQTVLLFTVMGYHLESNILHEIVGISIIAVFIIHNLLNTEFYKNLFKGKYVAVRVYRTAVNLLLLIAMCGVALSAAMISEKVLTFLHFGDVDFGRKLHMTATIWCFVLTALHFGFHVKQLVATFFKARLNAAVAWVLRLIFISAAVYGAVAFASRGLHELAFGLTDFPFLPYGEKVWKYALDYLSIFTLFALSSHYLVSLLLLPKKQKSNTEV